jgi:LysM repeat protein
MGINKSLFLACACFLSSFFVQLSAQKAESDTLIENGRKFKLHSVQPKQTLYSISRIYSVSQDSIIAFNPELLAGLKSGQTIKIPFGIVKTEKSDAKLTYTVEEKETLYSIAKKFNTSVEELERLNPEVKNGLKKGVVLNLPQMKSIEAKQESTEKKEEKKTKTCLPLTKEERSTKKYTLSFLLPFYSQIGSDQSKAHYAVDFYNGASLALDSLALSGLNASVRFYDTANDSAVIRKLFQKSELNQSDVIIGPLYSSSFIEAVRLAKKRNIPLVSPFAQNKAIVEGNQNAVKITPDVKTQYTNLVKTIQKKHPSANVVLLKNSNVSDKESTQMMKSCLMAQDYLPIKEVDYTGISSVKENLDANKRNVVIFLSSVQAQVLDFTAKLSSLASQFDILLVGLNEWNNYESINFNYLSNLNFHFTNTTLNLSENPAYDSFSMAYQTKFKKEPSVYAIQGFDVAFFIAQGLLEYGSGFFECLNYVPTYHGLNNTYEFKRSSAQNGFENIRSNVMMIKDMKYVKADNE